MPKTLFCFEAPASERGWTAIDDRVMGGVSRSRLRHDPAGYAVFEGRVWLARNGGFASVRSPAAALGLADAHACLVEVRGGRRSYKLSLFTDDGFDAPSYQSVFEPDAAWGALRLPLEDFRPTFRGREIPGAPRLDPTRIRQVGLMIAGRQAGPFALQIRSIALD